MRFSIRFLSAVVVVAAAAAAAAASATTPCPPTAKDTAVAVTAAADPPLTPVATSPPSTNATETRCRPFLAPCLAGLTSGGTCPDLLPVPAASFGARLRARGYHLAPIRPGVWSYEDGGYSCLFLRSADGRRLLLVDAPDSVASEKPDGSRTRLTDAAEEVLAGSTPHAVDIVYSHSHFDHIGGAARVVAYVRRRYPAARITTWGTASVRAVVRASTSKRAPEPSRLVRRRGATRIRVDAGLVLSLSTVGGHSDDDLAVHILPDAATGAPGVLHHVDVVFPGWAPPFTLAFTTDVRRFVAVHDVLLAKEWAVFSSGHIRATGSRGDVEASRAYVVDLLDAAADATAAVDAAALATAGAGQIANVSSPTLGHVWWLFVRVQRRLQRDACARTMLTKWGCVLAGVDVVVRDNCLIALTWVQVES